MWDSVLSVVASLGGGGVFGLVANLFKGWLDERAERTRRAHELALREQDRIDLERELEAGAVRHGQELEMVSARLSGVETQLSHEGMIASMRGANDRLYDPAMSNGQTWAALVVDMIIKLQRPTVILIFAVSIALGNASPVVNSLGGTAIGWLFGERYSLKKRANNA